MSVKAAPKRLGPSRTSRGSSRAVVMLVAMSAPAAPRARSWKEGGCMVDVASAKGRSFSGVDPLSARGSGYPTSRLEFGVAPDDGSTVTTPRERSPGSSGRRGELGEECKGHPFVIIDECGPHCKGLKCLSALTKSISYGYLRCPGGRSAGGDPRALPGPVGRHVGAVAAGGGVAVPPRAG